MDRSAAHVATQGLTSRRKEMECIVLQYFIGLNAMNNHVITK
jgi:hypothetical protein